VVNSGRGARQQVLPAARRDRLSLPSDVDTQHRIRTGRSA